MPPLRLGPRTFGEREIALMAIVNRTPDSFYDRGATFEFDAALSAVERAVSQGADIVDIGGVRAGVGDPVGPAEEIGRVVALIAEVRRQHPALVISVDTWRAEVADAALAAGANLVNDAWGGADPAIATVVAGRGGLVCTHAGGLAPRTNPHRVCYDDVLADVLARTGALARHAQAAGVHPESILIDPGHDFGKNTWHSLEVTRRLPELVASGWPVLVSLSNKDFVGETLGRPVDGRLAGTLAVTALCANFGARVFRAHNVAETRDVLDMVLSVRGDRPPAGARRGLA